MSKFVSLFKATIIFLWIAIIVVVSFALVVLTFSRKPMMWLGRQFWAPTVLWIAGIKTEVEWEDRFDITTPHVYVSNHASFMDIPVIVSSIAVDPYYIAKKELIWTPFLGQYMIVAGMIFVDRKNREKSLASIRKAGALIRAGKDVFAFPEGTRSKTGEIMPFKKGIFHIAIESQVPMVPIALHGTGDVMPAVGLSIKPGNVKVRFGPPIPTKGLTQDDRDALIEKVRAEILRLHSLLG